MEWYGIQWKLVEASTLVWNQMKYNRRDWKEKEIW